ncbi:MAG TPA: PAS domain S-box protein [Candidatus Angelobacter sp.]|jgi:PAS domain S-box-containing protein
MAIQALDRVKVATPSIAKQLIQAAIVFAAYFIAGKLGQATTNIRSGNLGPVWPAYGVALAAILIFGYRVWYAVAAAAFVVAFSSPVPALTALGQATGSTLGALTGAFLLSRLNFQRELARLQDALALIVVGAFGSALVSASLGMAVLYATQLQSYTGLAPAWLIYWLGDSTGVLLVTPLILTFPNFMKSTYWRRRAEFVVLFLLLTSLSLVVFSEVMPSRLKIHVLAFSLLPFVMWAALRFGMSGATLATFVIATIATIETALGAGPFAHNSPYTDAVLLVAFFTVLTLSGMALAAVTAERKRAQYEHDRLLREQAAMQARLHLATIVESSDDAIIATDLDGTITDWNKAAESLYGYSAEEIVGKSILLLSPSRLAGKYAVIVDEIRRGVPLKHHETVRLRKDGKQFQVSVTGSRIVDPDGQVIGLSAIERDITELKRQENIMRDSEERFRLAAHAGRMFAYEWDAATDVIVRSAEAATIIGVDESTTLSGEQALARVHADDRDRLHAALAALTPQKPYLRVSYRILRPDGSMIWVDRHSVAHFDEKGKPLRIVGMIADITERKRAEEALAAARNKLIEAQEQERTRIARELHDDIGQRLTLLTLELEQLRRSSPGLPAEVLQRLDELRNDAMEMGTDLQSLSHELHSSKLEYLGIAAVTQGFCREFAEKQKVEIDCKTRDLPVPLPPPVALCLFRILQEALHNSLKHSGVRHFEVRLWGAQDGAHLTVKDAGAGFDREEARAGRGLGLISMEERLKLLDGTLLIESQPNRGTTIHARVPLSSATDTMRAAG